jgi:unsaturated rhamnogalacturonyl hydrolase
MTMAPLALCALLAAAPTLEADIREVAALPGEPHMVAAAGVLKDETPVLTIENPNAFDSASTKRRAVVFASGSSAATADAVVRMVRWFKTVAPSQLRDQWELSALPIARFDEADTKSLSRWMNFQAPDVAIEIVDGDARPIGPGDVDTANWVIRLPVTDAALGSTLTSVKAGRSAVHDTIAARVSRAPLDIAKLLAKRYPEAPSISYIPSVSWVNTLRLAAISGDTAIRQRVLDQTRPWVSGERRMFGDRIQLTAVAGAMVFADLSKADGGNPAAEKLANEAAALAAAMKPGGVAEYGQGWTDDMFMTSSILSRTGHFDEAATLLTSYAGRLQRPDGLFNHAVDGPAAWGRGNGFAALGIAEALTAMPVQHPSRAALLEIYRRHMAAIKAQQSPDGMWRQVVDDPAAYREETATAMLLTAMARGIRLGWIDRSYVPVVDRAWHGLAAHVTADGTIIDVCTGTGAGPTHRYYFDRAAITGADDRGGAMALLASIEMYDFSKMR